MAAVKNWPRIFIRLFGAGVVLTVASAVVVYEMRREAALDRLRADKIQTVAAQGAFFFDVLRRLSADITILTNQTEFEEAGDDALVRIAREFSVFVQAVGNYREIRLLDAAGREVVESAADGFGTVYTRIASGAPSMSPEVAAAFDLPPGIVLMRPEVDTASEVARPISRFIAPVVSGTTGPRRVLATTYRFDLIFDRIFRLAHGVPGTLVIANAQGFWSTRVGDAAPRWRYDRVGADNPEALQISPDAWARILAKDHGTITTGEGFFAFTTLYPSARGFWGLDASGKPTPEASAWRIVAFVPPEAVREMERRLLATLVPTTIAALLALGLISWIGARHWVTLHFRQERLVRQATTDALTGTLNRAAFDEGVRAALARHAATGIGFALVYVDLDGFKAVNDRFGHEAGDACLKETARRIRTVIRESDLLGRLGGDEFAVILAPLKGRAATEAILDKIRAALAHGPAPFPGAEAPIAASLGAALCPDDATEPEMLLRTADRAMYVAKRRRTDPPT